MDVEDTGFREGIVPLRSEKAREDPHAPCMFYPHAPCMFYLLMRFRV